MKNTIYLKNSFFKLMEWVERRNYIGHDIYDGLNITSSRFILQNKLLNTAITQLFKRSPIDLRKLFKVEKTKMPKAVGLFLHAYVLLTKLLENDREGKLAINDYREKADFLKDWSIQHSLEDYSGACWNFGFNYKFMFDKPTIVITSIVAKSLFEYFQLTNCEQTKDILIKICYFMLNDLPITETDYGICFSYAPFKKDCCYNANMLGAEVLAKIYSIMGDEQLLDFSRRAVDFTIYHQHPDGKWNYSINLSTGKERQQIDFHQGYVLESLYEFMKYSRIVDQKYEKALTRGIEFYRNYQFFEDGRAKWRWPKVWPVDIHNQAQGIITFSKLSSLKKDYLNFAQIIAQWTIDNMQDKEGFFYYQKHKFFMNKIPYMRWAQAWMMLALTQLLIALNNK